MTSIASGTQDGGRLRLTVVPVIGAAPGEAPDQREIVLIDPADPGRVRLVLARALGLNRDERPDQREIVLSCPRDMVFETAVPRNIELTPPPR